MKRQTSVPTKSDKYYLKKGYGGYNPCILGNSKHRYCKGSVLVNCVGYATGRFNALVGAKKCAYLGNTNAENLFALAKKQGLETGPIPRAGAAMVWEGVGTAVGHVAIVEKVKSETSVETSESGWSYTSAYVTFKTRSYGTGNWGLGSSYKFLGFVYNPNIEPYENPADTTITLGEKGEKVKWLQWALVRSGYKIAIDGSFGNATFKALKKFQKKYSLTVDGKCGPKTQAKIKALYTVE